MRRREFIGLLAGAAAAWPVPARALRKDRLAKIGYLGIVTAEEDRRIVGGDPLSDGLRALGYVEGETYRFESRYAHGHIDRLPALAQELVDADVDVIVSVGPGAYAASRVTSKVPIVVIAGSDLVAMGLAASVAHPGGNVTGLTFFLPELMGKRLERLKQIIPSTSQVGVLLLSNISSTPSVLDGLRLASQGLNVEVRRIDVAGPAEFESAIKAATRDGVNGLLSTDPPPLMVGAASIADIAARLRLPSIGSPLFAASGGMLGFGVNFSDMARRAATYIDKILDGAAPSDLPIEQATKFTTVVNLKTAKALGIEIPATTLAAADEVIE